MGWVARANGGRYLYRSRRMGGRVVTEYLGAEGSERAALGREAWRLDQTRRVNEARQANGRVPRVVRGLTAMDRLTRDDDIRLVAHGLLRAVGLHRPKRGEWRMRRNFTPPAATLVEYSAPAGDAEAVAVFAAARAGDQTAVDRLPALLRDRGWVDRLGDIGATAAKLLVRRASGTDPVLRAAVMAKARALRLELEGDRPTPLEVLLVRRVVNSWLFAHAVESELSQAADPEPADPLDRLLTRAQRRLSEAVRELARVRRLQAPRLLARLQVAVPGPATNCPTPPRRRVRPGDQRQ